MTGQVHARSGRLLVLTVGELTRDPRARRQVLAALGAGRDVLGACGQTEGDQPASLAPIRIERTGTGALKQSLRPLADAARAHDSRLMLEVRGLYQLLRLGRLPVRLIQAARRLGPAEIVHANDFDTLPAASLLARMWGAKLVYDAHELYVDVEQRPPVVHRAVVRQAERILARAADGVITVSEPIAEELARTMRLRRRPLVVLNCADVEPGMA